MSTYFFSLVIGCGYTSQRSLCLYDDIVCVDIDKNKLYVAKERDHNAHYIMGDARSLPFKPDCIWDIICTDVLEHIKIYEKVIRNICEIYPRKIYIRYPTEIREHLLIKTSKIYREQHWGVVHVTIVRSNRVVNILKEFGYQVNINLGPCSSTLTRVILHSILEKLRINFQISEIGLVKFEKKQYSYMALVFLCFYIGLLLSLFPYLLWRIFKIRTIHDGYIIHATLS